MAQRTIHNSTQKIKQTYIVHEDESLSVISREVYGNPALWKHIYEANQDQMDDPNHIYPGLELIIPELSK